MPYALEVHHLTKDFSKSSGSFRALTDICLEIKQGEIFGIIGLSGAGKSTLLRCMSTLERSFSGRIAIQGTDVDFQKKSEIKRLRKQIGMIFQHFLLLESRTVLENVLLPLELGEMSKEERKEKAIELLSLVGLEHKKNTYPAMLSGGEKQRVGIARALATSPQILFCDEATSALDPKTTQEILQLLKQLNEKKGITIVLITHEMDVVRSVCHRVAVIDQGSIIEQGSAIDLFTMPEKKLTQQLVQASSHEINPTLLHAIKQDSLVVKLHFKGESAQKPILSELITALQIEINILSGWIDTIQSTTIGSLTVALKGSVEQKKQAFDFLQKNNVLYEVLHHDP